MASERSHDLPHRLEIAAVEHFGVGHLGALRHDDRDHHVAEVFPLGLAHRPPDGLGYLHGRASRLQEDHRVECRDVHALGEELCVADDPAPGRSGRVAALALQGCKRLRTRHGSGGAVNMVDFDTQVRAARVGGPHIAGDGLPQPALQPLVSKVCVLRARLGGSDRVGEGDSGPQVPMLRLRGNLPSDRPANSNPALRRGHGVPATEQLGGVVGVHLGLAGTIRGSDLRDTPARTVHGGFALVHAYHEHPVVRDEFSLDCLHEAHFVEHRAEHRLVVHRVRVATSAESFASALLDLATLALCEHAWRGRLIQALGRRDVLVAVDHHECRRVGILRRGADASGAMRFVAHDQIELNFGNGLRQNLRQHRNRLVGAEPDMHRLAGES